MKDEDKTKVEPIKDLKTLQKKREKSAVNNITKRKQAEEELKDSEEYLKILFDYAPDAYYINDLKGKFIDGNKAAERLIGYGREELIGKSFLKLNLLSLADIPKAAKALTKSIMGKPTGPDEFVLNRKDNSKVTVEISTYPVKIKGETLVLGIARDITERKKAIEEIEELAKFPTENPNPVLRISKDGIVLYHNYASESLLEQWHYKEEKPLQDRWFQFVLDALKDDDIKTVETEIGDKVISLTFAPIVEKDFVNVYGLDITECKQAEERVKHLNLVLRAIRSVNQLIVKVKDRESLLKGACNNLIKTRGYHSAWIALLDESGKLKTYAEAGIGKTFLPIVEMLMKGELTVCGQKALKQREIVITEDPASTCTGCPLAQKYSNRGAMTIRLEYNGKICGLMTVSIPAHLAVDQEEQSLFKEVAGDIAFSIHNIELDEERKQAEENLKNAKNELQIILDSVPAIIFYKDTEGRIVRANKALADSLKLPIKDIVGKTTEELFSKEQAEKMRKDDKEVMISGKPKRDIIQPYDTPEGTRWAITDKMPYKDKKGKITGVISLSKDITVQRKSEEELKQSYRRLKKTMDASIDTMSRIIEAKDPYTSGHQHRVCQLAVPIAQELGLSPDKVEGIRIASLIHDIGKIGIPTEILSKPTRLTDIEFSLIKGHSQIGYDILKSIDFSYPIAKIVLQHHERLNGSGYPNKLNGDKIIPEAKIIGVADVVEAMSSFRPYRPALGIDAALEEISKNRGILYDPEVVDACLKLFKEKGFKFE
jgi:PAS domain S-box-containing protein